MKVMRSKFLFPVILVVGLMFISFSVSQVYGQTPQKKTTTVQPVKYTCPEHPEVVMDKPGKCPKCGMQLVEKTNMKGKMHQAKDSTIVKKDKMPVDTTSLKPEPIK